MSVTPRPAVASAATSDVAAFATVDENAATAAAAVGAAAVAAGVVAAIACVTGMGTDVSTVIAFQFFDAPTPKSEPSWFQ